MIPKFNIGDRVRKITGYPFRGTVCAIYPHEDKCCVKHADQWEHIFHNKQLVHDHPEYVYLDLLKDILENGNVRETRNGTTLSVFGRQIRFDLTQGFPLLTTKKLHIKSIVGELLWFLSGSTNTRYLKENGITIWDEWERENGDVGKIYPYQWRHWGLPGQSIDQITRVIESLKADPHGRRHIVTAWNPVDVETAALPPCHILFQFYVNDGKLSCHLTQRSCDAPLGLPFNIASYALLTHLIAREVNLHVGELVMSLGDLHIYHNQLEGIETQLERSPYLWPYVLIETNKGIFDLDIEDIKFMHYNSHPAIKIPVSA